MILLKKICYNLKRKGGLIMKIITLSQQEFDKFASAHKYKNYYQTSSYGNLMSKHGYKVHYIGIIDSTNHLVGASLLYILLFL